MDGGGDMVSGFDNAVFVYCHRDTGKILALYFEDAVVMTGRDEWVHVGSLEPRAWIEANWAGAMAAPSLINALQRMVRHERGQDQHSDRVGALYMADMALNRALGDEEWPI